MANPGLLFLAQEEWSAGMFRAVARQLIPPTGAFDLVNYLLNDDGSLQKRGGSAYQSTDGLGAPLKFLWDGQLGPGARTLIASTADFAALDASDGVVNMGGAGLAAPRSAVALGGILFVGGGFAWGGSRKSATYSTGTVSVTNGSRTVTGSGTTFATLTDAGQLFQRGAGTRLYPVASIDSVTQLTLRDPYEGATLAGQTYTLDGVVTLGAPYRTADRYLVVANRLLTLEGNKVYFSNGPSETGVLRPHVFTDSDFHELDGVTLGGGAVRDKAVIFTTSGAWVISGLSLDLTDDLGNIQHRVERLTDELRLWNHEGIATWRGSLVVPATDAVWLVDGVSQPTKVSVSITPLITAYVDAGYHCGNATVYQSTYFLPILDASEAVVDLLVCRLDRPTDTPAGRVWPWTRFDDFGGDVTALAVRVGSTTRRPKLLAASNAAAGRVLDLSSAFTPTAARKAEADSSNFSAKVITRDYSTGGRNPNLVRGATARYELVDAASDNPTISAAYSVGVLNVSGLSLWDTALWDTGVWQEADAGEFELLPGSAPEDDGRHPFTWGQQTRTRYVRYRLLNSTPAARLTLRSLELSVRPSGKA